MSKIKDMMIDNPNFDPEGMGDILHDQKRDDAVTESPEAEMERLARELQFFHDVIIQDLKMVADVMYKYANKQEEFYGLVKTNNDKLNDVIKELQKPTIKINAANF